MAENRKIVGPGGGSGKLDGSCWKAMKSTTRVDTVVLGEKKREKGREANVTTGVRGLSTPKIMGNLPAV